jgi:Glycosyl transferase family 2
MTEPMTSPLGVVIPCYRQERFLPRTVAALEQALAGRQWRGVLVLAAGRAEAGVLPALSDRWQVLAPPVARPLTPGGARMLGFAACGGEWVLFVDADVEVERAWIDRALTEAEGARAVGGLWGRIEEWFVDGAGERPGSRDLYHVGGQDADADYLASLAFYRRSALLSAGGYDARLSSEEDFELGLRMRRAGHVLRTLAPLAARHWSAPRPSFSELGRRWRTGLCFGQGQVLRLYIGRPGFGTLLRRQRLNLATLATWLAGLAALVAALHRRDPLPLLAWLALPGAAFLAMTLRKRSARLALHSLLSWSLNGFGLAIGLFRLPPAGARAFPGGEVAC